MCMLFKNMEIELGPRKQGEGKDCANRQSNTRVTISFMTGASYESYIAARPDL